MAYWLDDGFDTWPEVVRAGKAAAGLYVCCGAWVARNISNGSIADAVIPVEIATMYGTPEWVAKLVTVGLWRTKEAGYRDVRYFTMGNPTAEKVVTQKAQKADRQRRWLDKQKETRLKTSPRRSRDASQVASKDDAPSLPPLKGDGVRPRKRGATRPGHQPHCPYQDRDPASCSVCASERLAAGQLVEQELPLPWPPNHPLHLFDAPATATPPTAPTPDATPADAPSAPANASPRPTPRPPRQPRRRPPSAQDQPSPPAPAATNPPPPDRPTPAAGEPPPYPPGLDRHHAVWIATRRRGIEAHRPVDDSTACHRSMRTGIQLPAQEANDRHHATWCPRCWPRPKESAA